MHAPEIFPQHLLSVLFLSTVTESGQRLSHSPLAFVLPSSAFVCSTTTNAVRALCEVFPCSITIIYMLLYSYIVVPFLYISVTSLYLFHVFQVIRTNSFLRRLVYDFLPLIVVSKLYRKIVPLSFLLIQISKEPHTIIYSFGLYTLKVTFKVTKNCFQRRFIT